MAGVRPYGPFRKSSRSRSAVVSEMDDLNKIIEDAKKGIGASQSAIESASSAVSLVISQAIASGLQLSEQGINVASESAAWAMDQGQVSSMHV